MSARSDPRQSKRKSAKSSKEDAILERDAGLDSAVVPLRTSLLKWYRANRRDLPWRRTRDPYAIWVSEIMLQQTRVAAVYERYKVFLQNFPSVEALAKATESEVLALWSGLGYYRRARMLHKAAKVVTDEHGGQMPKTASALRTLPGIGAYTSAAISSIAYGEPVAVVDGNVERVVQRLAGWGSDSSAGQAKLTRLIEERASLLLDPEHAGDFNQAMMELGATICLPKNPQCLICPLRPFCKTQGEHPTPDRARMRSQDVAYALVLRPGIPEPRQIGEVFLVQRSSQQTVMPDMWELPPLRDPVISDAHLRLTVRHAIMQVNYRVRIRAVLEEQLEALSDALTEVSERGRWFRITELDTLPLTGLARKVLLKSKLAELAESQ